MPGGAEGVYANSDLGLQHFHLLHSEYRLGSPGLQVEHGVFFLQYEETLSSP